MYQLTARLIIVNYLSGYLKKTFLLEKPDWFFIFNRDKHDWLPNQRKEQIIYFLQLTKALKTKKPTTVVFNVFHGSVWQAVRKMCLLSHLIGVFPSQKGTNSFSRSSYSESPSNPHEKKITGYQDSQQKQHTYIEQIPAHVTYVVTD